MATSHAPLVSSPDVDDVPSVAARARAVIPRLIHEGTSEVPDLARALAMSRRSLERALAAEHTSGATLFDEERHRLAQLWLPSQRVEEVGRRLGYANAPAFSRAFRRWTGTSPGAYRRARRGAI